MYAEVGAIGELRAKLNLNDLTRKKRSPWGFDDLNVVINQIEKTVNTVTKEVPKVFEEPLNILDKTVKDVKKEVECGKLLEQTSKINLVSTGVVKMGIILNLVNTTFSVTTQGLLLSFIPTFHIVGQVVSWNLDQVSRTRFV